MNALSAMATVKTYYICKLFLLEFLLLIQFRLYNSHDIVIFTHSLLAILFQLFWHLFSMIE